MGENSKIGWTDHTFNPWIGCQKVAPECDNCYAEALNQRWNRGENWGPKALRRRTSPANWKKPLKWAAGSRVFCGSLCDIFDNKAPEGARDDLWKLIRDTPDLFWMLLTKRPQNVAKMLPPDWGLGYANVILMTSAGTKESLRKNSAALMLNNARFWGLSAEPLLESLTIPAFFDWVIAGGESGPKHRPMKPDWVRSIRDQCAKDGTAFFFKQWGGPRPGGEALLDGREHRDFPKESGP